MKENMMSGLIVFIFLSRSCPKKLSLVPALSSFFLYAGTNSFKTTSRKRRPNARSQLIVSPAGEEPMGGPEGLCPGSQSVDQHLVSALAGHSCKPNVEITFVEDELFHMTV